MTIPQDSQNVQCSLAKNVGHRKKQSQIHTSGKSTTGEALRLAACIYVCVLMYDIITLNLCQVVYFLWHIIINPKFWLSFYYYKTCPGLMSVELSHATHIQRIEYMSDDFQSHMFNNDFSHNPTIKHCPPTLKHGYNDLSYAFKRWQYTFITAEKVRTVWYRHNQ